MVPAELVARNGQILANRAELGRGHSSNLGALDTSPPMIPPDTVSFQTAGASPAAGRGVEQFRDGAAAIDVLLAEIGPRDARLIDAVLDLRMLCTAHNDAAACVAQLMRVRRLLDGRCDLAFYRVCYWARTVLRIQVRSGRGMYWISRRLPTDAARVDEIINTALAALYPDSIPLSAQVRFVFVAQPAPSSWIGAL
jgi:hypothetical protein